MGILSYPEVVKTRKATEKTANETARTSELLSDILKELKWARQARESAAGRQ